MSSADLSAATFWLRSELINTLLMERPTIAMSKPAAVSSASASQLLFRRGELAEAVRGRRRASLDRLVAEMAQHVGGEVAGRVVAPRLRSFSRAFITIQSRSPRTSLAQPVPARCGGWRRWTAAIRSAC